MKILILNGSPRANGNTAAMVQAFKESAESAGHTVTTAVVGRMKISGCIACEYCHTKGNGTCAQNDDMQKIYPCLQEADMLVIASPIYYFTLTGQIQCALQRMYCINHPPKAVKAALLLSSASPDVYSGAIAEYKDILSYCGIENAGIITAYGGQNKSASKLAEIREFAKTL
ncbi:MAG: flavodoxin family protein [Methanocorpusculum sp.]|nr:flavodoxin family protein [Methanocorpusculum sp.]